MKAVILAGGMGTRMGPDTTDRPKPLLEIGGHPILWHILKIYEAHGITDFVICAGHAGHHLIEHFARHRHDPWCVQVADTGERTATGGRLRRIRHLLGDEAFCMTYGDGVANVNISELLAFHRGHGRLVTLTAVHPRLPFGLVTFPDGGSPVIGFDEKPEMAGMWVNSGFFVIEPRALDAITSDDESWEREPLTRLADRGEVAGFRHTGFWQCMDAPGDRRQLDHLWHAGQAPWKVW
ncbi:MAG: glucose-1-phosphate cytidylyltransferase [Acidimicrobiia bacterium]|nr:glucose-1-phosphate cytidylyltransferase [Acidimicrobiia bacterium]